MPKLSTLSILRILKLRCRDYAARLDGLRGRAARIGRNPNIMGESYLDKAIECFEEVEQQEAAEAKRSGVKQQFEHSEASSGQ